MTVTEVSHCEKAKQHRRTTLFFALNSGFTLQQ